MNYEKRKSIANTLLAAYAVMMVFTFGHARVLYKQDEYVCELATKYQDCQGKAAVDSLFASMFWPLYWSVRVNEVIAEE